MALHLKSTGVDFTDFAGPSAGSTVAELLDDYEEGTWTFAITYISVNTAYYSKYVKTGMNVSICNYIDLSNDGSGNYTTVSGFPFATETHGYATMKLNRSSNLSSYLRIAAGDATAIVQGTDGRLYGSNLDGEHFIFSGIYFTAVA